jgi:dTDP-4-dehydrorhamnose 3,5-epimerase
MKIVEKGPEGIKVLKPIIFKDNRGHFYESLNVKLLSKILKKKISIKQSNVSFSKKNVFRGFHFQKNPYAQDKFVRVLNGTILDIIVCIDKNSKNYLNTYNFELSDKNKKILYVPKKFAHGFLVISKNATIEYFVTNYYSKSHEKNINIFDKKLNIDKKITQKKLIMSVKDKTSNFK